jgi:hypothetical protein
MKVLDLACSHGHGFEGWFGSEDDFQSQLAHGLVQCPICDDAKITKKLSAPRLNLSGARQPASADASPDTCSSSATSPIHGAPNSVALRADAMLDSGQIDAKNITAKPQPEHPLHALMQNPEFQAAYMQMAKEVLAKTEDVGADFAREARKIHYGESKDRGIRGQASHDETMELLDEGIDVMPLPLPKALKGTLQ